MVNFSILGAALITGALMWWPRVRSHVTWRAMITPLASIIGSGFLVLGPVLEHAYGRYAPLAMALLCLVAFGFGAAVRTNIAEIGEDTATPNPKWAETLGSVLLGFAYTISVAYYLNLFGSFAFSLTPYETPFNARLLTTAVYVLIAVVGWTKGFKMLETMEYASVSLKLAIIAGLLVGLAHYTWLQAGSDALTFNQPSLTGWPALTLGFGLIVTVQGFETSRYLGSTYSASTRIGSMTTAQMLSAAIYMVYIVLIAATFTTDAATLSETAIVDMMGTVSALLPPLLVGAALAAQFSAAVADTGGCGGLVAEVARHSISDRQAYALVVAIGLALTWTTDIFQIIAHASRAFAAYYAVQAALAAWRIREKAQIRALVYLALAVLGVAIVIFGRPIE